MFFNTSSLDPFDLSKLKQVIPEPTRIKTYRSTTERSTSVLGTKSGYEVIGNITFMKVTAKSIYKRIANVRTQK